MTWFLLAFIAMVLFGTTNFIDRFLVEKRIKDPFFVSIIGGILAPLIGVIVFVMRGFPILPARDVGILVLGGLLAEVALVPWYKAIKIDDTSRVVPYFQFIPVIILGMSYLLLGERLTMNQLIGFALIIVGGLSLAIEHPSREFFRIRKSFWYIIVSIMLWAPMVVLFKMIAVEQNFWDSIAYNSIGIGLGAIVLQIYAKTRTVAKIRAMSFGTWGVVIANELLYLLARVLQFYAVLIGPTALVSVVGGVQPLFALVVGLALSIWFPDIIKEDIKKKTIAYKLVAIVVMFIGIVFINR